MTRVRSENCHKGGPRVMEDHGDRQDQTPKEGGKEKKYLNLSFLLLSRSPHQCLPLAKSILEPEVKETPGDAV